MLIERKEKKSKGLFYLIFTLTIIAALTISCKNKPTGTNEFAWVDETIEVPPTYTPEEPNNPKYEITQKNWSILIDKIIKSEVSLDDGGIGYFWAEFSDTGIKYGQGDAGSPPQRGSHKGNHGNYDYTSTLNIDAMADNKLNSSDGKISLIFTLNNNEIANVKVVFTSDSGTSFSGKEIICKFTKETKL